MNYLDLYIICFHRGIPVLSSSATTWDSYEIDAPHFLTTLCFHTRFQYFKFSYGRRPSFSLNPSTGFTEFSLYNLKLKYAL